jgi:hypothetical protein
MHHMRKLKTLGVMLVAVFAMSAVVAASASADDFTAEKNTVTLTGDQDKGLDKFTTTVGIVSCNEVKYHGTATTGSTTVKIAPTYNGCTGFGFPATIHMNGCEYALTLTEQKPEVGPTTTTVEIVCPTGKEITITAVAAGTTKCTVHVPPQTGPSGTTGLKHIEWHNVGAGQTRELTGTITITGITYKHTEGTGLGKCTTGHSETGSYNGLATVTGEEHGGGAHVGIFLSKV